MSYTQCNDDPRDGQSAGPYIDRGYRVGLDGRLVRPDNSTVTDLGGRPMRVNHGTIETDRKSSN